MTSAGPGSAGPLDGPPPSPAMGMMPGGGAPGAGGMGLSMGAGGAQPMPDFAQMSQPLTAGTPGRAVSPEVAVGIMQTAETMYGILDSIASMVPDLANDMALQKDLLQRSMGKLLVGSGQSGNPGSPGLNFPGGGFSGVM